MRGRCLGFSFPMLSQFFFFFASGFLRVKDFVLKAEKVEHGWGPNDPESALPDISQVRTRHNVV